MKGSKQMIITGKDLNNMAAESIYENAMNELRQIKNEDDKVYRLRSCTAWVYETENFYILRSYNTYIAAIEKDSGYCADVLRKVYGYTNTSAQHIAKFTSDYGSRAKVYRWRY